MTESPAHPARCVTCAVLEQAPLACADCHELVDHVLGADYFELFGLPRGFDLDPSELHRKYLAICRNVHPDAVAGKSDEVQSLSLSLSAAVNQAHETLRDPRRRAEYLLEISGGRSAADDRRVPPELLAQVMALREEIEEARSSGDRATLDRIRQEVEAQSADASSRIAVLARQINDTTRDSLRLQLNAMKYYDNLLAQLT